MHTAAPLNFGYKALVGDGSADDTAALAWLIDQAADRGEPVYLEAGRTYMVSEQLIVKSGVQIIGRTYRNDAPKRATIKSNTAAGNAVLLVQSGASNVRFENLKVDADDTRTWCIKGTTCTNVEITNCELTNNDTAYLIEFDGAATDIRITNNQLSNTIGGIKISGAARRVTVSGNTITEWLNYGIVLYAGDSNNPAYVSIENNTLHTPSTGVGGARQMIVSYYSGSSPAASLVGIRVINNMCIGPGTPFSLTSSTSRGTGDQISLNYALDFVVANNVSIDGGENGLVVQYSNNGVVSANVVKGADGHGIQVSSLLYPCENVNITGNTIVDCGVRADGSADVMAGIYIQDGVFISVIGNQICDTRGTRKMKYGVLCAVTDYAYPGPNAIQFVDTSEMTPWLNQTSTNTPDMTISP